MSRLSHLFVSTAVSFGAALTTALSAGAHSAPLPIGHIGLGHFAATSHFPITAHSHIASAFPGAGSLSTRVNGYTIKSIQIAGITNGENFAISRQLGGAISSGLLNGDLYIKSGNSYYDAYTYSYAIGSNPFNTGTFGFTSSYPGAGNNLTFVNGGSSTLKHGSGGGTGVFGASAFGKSAGLGTSGSARAQNLFYNSIASSSTLTGIKSIQSLGPLSGGQLFGTFGQSFGGNLTNYIGAGIAFGNSPLNNHLFGSTVPVSSVTNFLTFGNVTRQVTGGQLLFTLYTPSFRYGTYGLSFGNSPFNVIPGTFALSSIKNAINFAPIVTGHHF